jgi:hypothetical protein
VRRQDEDALRPAIYHFQAEQDGAEEGEKERDVFGVDEGVSPQQRLGGEEGGDAQGDEGGEPAARQAVKEHQAEQEGQEVDQVPGLITGQSQALQQGGEGVAQQEVGGAAGLVIGRAGAVGLFQIEIWTKPVPGLVSVG